MNRESPCTNCERRSCESIYNEGECWQSPHLWIEWLKLKVKIERDEREHEGLDPYANDLPTL